MEVRDRAFRGETIKVDGNTYVDCIFEHTILEYGGGEALFDGCKFTGGTNWRLTGDLERGLALLAEFAQSSGPQAVDALIGFLSATVRKKPGVREFRIE